MQKVKQGFRSPVKNRCWSKSCWNPLSITVSDSNFSPIKGPDLCIDDPVNSSL